jgi:hypothetical protein
MVVTSNIGVVRDLVHRSVFSKKTTTVEELAILLSSCENNFCGGFDRRSYYKTDPLLLDPTE